MTDKQFTFAGFTYPRRLWEVTNGPASLKRKWEGRKYTGGYFISPRPDSVDSVGFYLASDGQPFTRWQWCDDVADSCIEHTGWFCDGYQDSKIRGIVVNLTHGRYLAGWSMGESMASTVDRDVYTCPIDAARAADSMAETAAEREREYQEQWQERQARDDLEALEDAEEAAQ